MNMNATGGILIGIDCDDCTQKTILEVSRLACMAVAFMTFAEFVFANIPPSVIILVALRRAKNLSEFIATIRAAHPEAEIIILSQVADEHLCCEALKLGACDLLPIPPERNDLLLAVIKAQTSKELPAPCADAATWLH